MARNKPGAQPRRGIVLEDHVASRVRSFIARVGTVKARERLRIGDATLEAARDRGTIQSTTAERLLEALEREEAREAS